MRAKAPRLHCLGGNSQPSSSALCANDDLEGGSRMAVRPPPSAVGRMSRRCVSQALVLLSGLSCLLFTFSFRPFITQQDDFSASSTRLCHQSWAQRSPPTTIFVVTPTAAKRKAQKADLTRLSQTLRLVPNLHWLLVEDSQELSPVLEDLLVRSGLNFTHLATTDDPSRKRARGMGQRDLAMSWLRERFRGQSPESVDAVLYFADDDNAYDTRLFEAFVRRVEGVGVWPVAFPSNQWVETAIVDPATGKVAGWDTAWNPRREFAMDMAAFAIHLSLILRFPTAAFGNGRCGAGNYEPCFLKQLGGLRKENLTVFGHGEPKEVLVWHTKTKQNEIPLKGSRKGFII